MGRRRAQDPAGTTPASQTSGRGARSRRAGRGLMIYGSSGFTGRLIVARALEAGLAPDSCGARHRKGEGAGGTLGPAMEILHPRRFRRQRIGARRYRRRCPRRRSIRRNIGPMIEACLRARVHYLDISGELPVFQDALRRDKDAIGAGVMLMPGAAWSVVATDCLAAHIAERLPNPKYLRIGIARSTLASRGSARTALGLFSSQVAVRRNGALTNVPLGALERSFDYGEGPRPSTALSWPDVLCAWRTTGVPNIEVYMDVGGAARILAPLSARSRRDLPASRPSAALARRCESLAGWPG